MSHTISARKADGFKVEVIDWEGSVVHSGWYQDRNKAQDVAEYYERFVTLGDGAMMTLDDVFADMDDDELLRELGV